MDPTDDGCGVLCAESPPGTPCLTYRVVATVMIGRQILGQGAMANPMFALKGPLMQEKNFAANFPLKHAQKDMRFALALGDEVRVSWARAARLVLVARGRDVVSFGLMGARLVSPDDDAPAKSRWSPVRPARSHPVMEVMRDAPADVEATWVCWCRSLLCCNPQPLLLPGSAGGRAGLERTRTRVEIPSRRKRPASEHDILPRVFPRTRFEYVSRS